MSRPVTITDAVLAKLVAFLAPLFVDAAGGDTAAARQTAASVLASYNARTDTELRFVALIVAFSFAALDALSRSADPTLTTNQVLRLRGNANALNRAAQQNQTRLEDLRRQAAQETPEPSAELPPESPADLPASTEPSDMLAFARFQPPAELSRQQRRAAERQAEKQRLSQQEEARLARRAAERDAARAGLAQLAGQNCFSNRSM